MPEPSHHAGAWISRQRLIRSNYNLQWGGWQGKPDSAPSTGIPYHPSLHPGVAEGHLLPAEMPHLGWGAQRHRIPIPALEQDLGHLQERAGPSLPSTFGHPAGPAAPGTPTARCASTHSPVPSPPTAVSGQLLKPQVPGNSPQPYKQQQVHQQHSWLLKEKHNGSEDAQASKFTRILKSGARIRALYKGDAKQPPRSIPVTSRLTGAAFHAAALRGNLIHFLIRHQLPPVQCSQTEWGWDLLPVIPQNPALGGSPGFYKEG